MRDRRVVRPAWTKRLVAGAAGAVLAMAASPVYAQDDEGSGAEEICGLHDSRLAEASGITAAADGDGWWIVPDGDDQDSTLSVHRVGADCSVRPNDEAYIDKDPRDPQALALDADGYLWIADTGEALDRDSIAVNKVHPENLSGSEMYRFVFPGGPEETEAFLVHPETNTPVFITAGDGEANLYAPTGEMLLYDTPMENLGTVALSEGGSVTGAAMNADGTKVVLRTANAAYEWTVEGGDVVGALTGAEPVVTPLADEGEAQDITYDAEGNFVTLSLLDSNETYATLNKYTPAAPPAPEPTESAEAQAEGGGEAGGGIVDFILDLGFGNIVKILAGIAVVGFLVMLGGILVIRKSRRARAEAEDDDDEELGFAAEESVFGDAKDDPVDIGLDAGQPDPEVGQIAQGGAVYGAPKAEPAGNVYGAKRAEQGGNVYGGARPEASGSVYGSQAPERPPEPAAPAQSGAPQYGAFEGAGQGSIYNDGGGGAYGTPRQQQGGVYGGGEAAGQTYGSPPEPGGAHGGRPSNAESTGTVYGGGGGRTPEQPNEDYWGPPDDRRR